MVEVTCQYSIGTTEYACKTGKGFHTIREEYREIYRDTGQRGLWTKWYTENKISTYTLGRYIAAYVKCEADGSLRNMPNEEQKELRAWLVQFLESWVGEDR